MTNRIISFDTYSMYHKTSAIAVGPPIEYVITIRETKSSNFSWDYIYNNGLQQTKIKL